MNPIRDNRDFATKVRAFQTVSRNGRIACAHCGFHIWDCLHLDHINNDGAKHRAELGKGGKGAGMRTYRWVLRNPDLAKQQLQILCANCDRLKQVRGYLPDIEDPEDFHDEDFHDEE